MRVSSTLFFESHPAKNNLNENFQVRYTRVYDYTFHRNTTHRHEKLCCSRFFLLKKDVTVDVKVNF